MGMIVTAGDAAWRDARLNWLKALRRYPQREGQHYETERGRPPHFRDLNGGSALATPGWV